MVEHTKVSPAVPQGVRRVQGVGALVRVIGAVAWFAQFDPQASTSKDVCNTSRSTATAPAVIASPAP